MQSLRGFALCVGRVASGWTWAERVFSEFGLKKKFLSKRNTSTPVSRIEGWNKGVRGQRAHERSGRRPLVPQFDGQTWDEWNRPTLRPPKASPLTSEGSEGTVFSPGGSTCPQRRPRKNGGI